MPELYSTLPSSDLSVRALDILQKTYGFQAFRGAQGEIIRHIAAGQHAFVLMPTGGGKSLSLTAMV